MSGDEIRIGVLGPLSVARGGSEVEIRSAKQRLLLAVLVSQGGHPVTLDRLVEILWPASAPASARANVQTYMHRLRGLLGGDAIRSRASGYQLGEAVACDAAEFEREVAGARDTRDDGNLKGAAVAYRVALQAWRGEAFDGLSDAAPLAVEAARLDEMRLVARQECYDCELALGHHRSLIPELTRAVADHPLDEHVLAQAMTALDGAGRSADALEMFRRARRRMADELGVEPGPRLQELQQSILAHTTEGNGAGTEPGSTESSDLPPAQLPAAVTPFIGRGDDVAALATELLAAGPGPAVVLLTGAGGAGKSALAVHAAHRVADRFPDGQLYVDLRGATPGIAPLSALETLARLVGTLTPQAAPRHATVDELAGRFRSLLAGRRVLLVLDDAADAAQVRPLLPGSSTCAVLITSRRPLAALEGAVRHRLGELTAADALHLLDTLAGEGRAADNPSAADDVLRWCGRLPLAIGLAGSKLAARPHWDLGTLRDRLAAEEHRLDELEVEDRGVRRSLALSVADLSPDATQLFILVGSLPTPSVGAEVAAALVDGTARAAQPLLDELTDAHLLDPVAGGRYRVHDLVRLFARELAGSSDHRADLEAASRRVLHHYLATARCAIALFGEPNPWKMRLIPETLSQEPAPLAGPEAVRTWYADELVGMIDIATYAARIPGDLPGLVIALAAAQRTVLEILGRWHEAQALAAVEQVAATTSGDPAHQAQADQDQAVMERYAGRDEASLRHARRALGYWHDSGDRLGEAHALTAVAEALRRLGRNDERLETLLEAIHIRREVGDRAGEAGMLTILGIHHLQHADLAVARAVTLEAVAAAEDVDDDGKLAVALGVLGEIQRRWGDLDEAADSFERALALDTAAGRDGTMVQAEHWWGLGRTLRQRHDTGVPGTSLSRARECWNQAADVLLAVGLITDVEHQQIVSADDPQTPPALTQMF